MNNHDQILSTAPSKAFGDAFPTVNEMPWLFRCCRSSSGAETALSPADGGCPSSLCYACGNFLALCGLHRCTFHRGAIGEVISVGCVLSAHTAEPLSGLSLHINTVPPAAAAAHEVLHPSPHACSEPGGDEHYNLNYNSGGDEYDFSGGDANCFAAWGSEPTRILESDNATQRSQVQGTHLEHLEHQYATVSRTITVCTHPII